MKLEFIHQHLLLLQHNALLADCNAVAITNASNKNEGTRERATKLQRTVSRKHREKPYTELIQLSTVHSNRQCLARWVFPYPSWRCCPGIFCMQSTRTLPLECNPALVLTCACWREEKRSQLTSTVALPSWAFQTSPTSSFKFSGEVSCRNWSLDSMASLRFS